MARDWLSTLENTGYAKIINYINYIFVFYTVIKEKGNAFMCAYMYVSRESVLFEHIQWGCKVRVSGCRADTHVNINTDTNLKERVR